TVQRIIPIEMHWSPSQRRWAMPRESRSVAAWAVPVFFLYAIMVALGLLLLWRYWPARVEVGDDPAAARGRSLPKGRKRVRKPNASKSSPRPKYRSSTFPRLA